MSLISFSVDSAVSPIMVNVLDTLNVIIGEDIGISPLTKKLVKLKNSYVADKLL